MKEESVSHLEMKEESVSHLEMKKEFVKSPADEGRN